MKPNFYFIFYKFRVFEVLVAFAKSITLDECSVMFVSIYVPAAITKIMMTDALFISERRRNWKKTFSSSQLEKQS